MTASKSTVCVWLTSRPASGEPLVFVHGSLEDLRIWRRQVELFSAHYRVVTYSRRYHHPTPAPGAGDPAYTAALHAPIWRA